MYFIIRVEPFSRQSKLYIRPVLTCVHFPKYFSHFNPLSQIIRVVLLYSSWEIVDTEIIIVE